MFFRKKLILVLALIALFIFTVYTIYLIALEVLKIIKKVAVNFQAPIINGDELKTTVGLYYLDFEYDENLTYEVIYESSYGIKEEKLKYRNLLTQVGNLLPDVEYEIHLYAYGKIKKKFCRVEANKVIKFTLQNKASELQRMIANYEVSNSQLVDCYIETLQVFDKMYKRMLIHAPEVHIIESLNKRILFAKMILLRDSIVVRFNFNPYLLEDNSKIINAFEEDCLLPSKYIIESLDDVYYMHKLVETMKNMKSKIE